MTEVEESQRHGRRGALDAPCYVGSNLLPLIKFGGDNAFSFLNDLKPRENCLSFTLCGLKSCGHGGHRTQRDGFVALIFLKFVKIARIVDTAKLKN